MREQGPWGLLLSAQAPMWLKAQGLQPGWLSESEQQRLASLGAGRQSLFMACRYALRLLLAQQDGALTAWRLGSAAEQAPWVEFSPEVDAPQRLQLSLSHSRGWLACAKAPVPVGVDLEVQRTTRQRDVPALAAQVCAPVERAWLLSQPEALQSLHFLQLWCLKEAYYKCLGTGLDWTQIRQFAWRHMGDEGGAGTDVSAPIAYAHLWQARTSATEQLVLALCARQPLPLQVPWLPVLQEGLVWGPISLWQLYAESAAI